MKFNSKVVSLVLALCLVLGFTSAVYAAAPDVNGHWAQAEIEKWIDNGMAAGYPDGSFKPDNNITRAEFVTLLNRSLGQKDSSATCSFADVKASDWYYSDVASAAKAGYVNGYEDNTFKPDQVISRVEAGVIVARVLQLPAGNQEAINKFTDAGAIAEWAMGSISAMVEKNLLGGYPDGSFNPNAPVTRAESVVILDRAQTASSASVPVTGVKLSSSTLSISVGNYKQLTATVEPANASNKAVTWESSNTSIATVDNSGKVKGVAEGKATITVTTVGGKKTATCEAIVTRRSGGGSGGGGGGSDRDTVSEVTASPAAGAVAAGTTVTLSSATTDATIYYTTDGSTPNTSSTKYTGPITINTAVTIKAYAVKSGMDASEVVSFAYTIGEGTWDPAIQKVEVVTDPAGNTVVKVFIKESEAATVTGVAINGFAANKRPDSNEWRKTLDGAIELEDLNVVVTRTGASTWDPAIQKVEVVADPAGNTVVKVFIKESEAATVTGVTVNGFAANKRPDSNEWRKTLDGVKTIEDITVVVAKSGDGVVNKAALTAAITAANAKAATAVVGTAPGNYPAAAKAAFEEAIDDAQAVADNSNATQAEVDAAVAALAAATATFDAAKVPASSDDVIKMTASFIDTFGILYLSLTLQDGVTASSVTVDGQALTPQATAGKYMLIDEQPTYIEGDSVTFTVVTTSGTVTRTVAITRI